jgi:hypothetical protein
MLMTAIAVASRAGRRRSGSHYTPRALTEPTVRSTLEPILKRLHRADGRPPRPEQILDLKVCDPAMGSGAFLVEACRQLGDALIEAWHAHGEIPAIPPDEDEVIFARRLIAQRCLYGVDRNPVAVDLAKVSLWLVTLAKDHALTFMDHALRHGDSLVGLSRKQIEAFHWDSDALAFQAGFEAMRVREHVAKVAELRGKIREAGEIVSDSELRGLWGEAQFELEKVRLFGDLVVAAYFEGETRRIRDAKRSEFASTIVSGNAERHRVRLDEWRHAKQPLVPFHWEIEFPEIFDRANPGFDAVVGNPPFAHKNEIIAVGGPTYMPYLQFQFLGIHGYSDLCVYFIRRTDALTRRNGCWTLICTKTVTEGKSRSSGLGYVIEVGSTIITAQTDIQWPGVASLVVCAPTVFRGEWSGEVSLNGVRVSRVSAALEPGVLSNPLPLKSNKNLSSTGFLTYGRNFVLDRATAESMRAANPKNVNVVIPLLAAGDFTDDPSIQPSQYVIDFGNRSESEAAEFSEPFKWVERYAKPERLLATRDDAQKYWWRLVGRAERVYAEADRQGLSYVLANLHLAKHHAFARLRRDIAP